MDKKTYDYWLYGIDYIGRKTFSLLREHGYDGENLFLCNENELPSFLNQKQRDSLLKAKRKNFEQIKEEYEKVKKGGIFMTVFGDDDYPKKLYEIPDAPAVLFYKGKLPGEKQPLVAIIGARNCSGYGRLVAEKFAAFFAKNKVGVISGMAAGIDGYAQREALNNGGYSVGVLGSGVQVCYPKEHRALYDDLVQKGCVLSEYLPYINASPNLFPPRNRIISGLADALIVVEAKEKSGTLITVEMALEQGKEVFVVPGRITDGLSQGCNRLLWEGATPAIHPQKIMESLYQKSGVTEEEKEENLSFLQKNILSFLDVTPVHINVLQERTGLSMEVLSKELLYLTLEDQVVLEGSNWYRKQLKQL